MMTTFFSAPGNQTDVGGGGDMTFHHYPQYNQYPESSMADLAPLPATAVTEERMAAQGDNRNELAFMGATEENQRQLMMMTSSQAMQHHGLLSLSLATQDLYQYGPASAHSSSVGGHQAMAAVSRGAQNGEVVRSSQYLKAARELLDELVNVQDAVGKGKAGKNRAQGSGEHKKDADQSEDKASNRKDTTVVVDSSMTDLSPSERQDLQNKVTALQGLLDQADERYRQYRQQMQALASSLDAAAGRGAARPYTALALQTISRHFRSLRDAIGAQLQSARRSLGEPDSPAHGGGIHRLRHIDRQLRQQRAAQQLGMFPHHQLHEQQNAAWRPQRGLPESAVSVLRSWLFEHFLHPYPKEPEKLMLARRTGLTRGQVSNWFINARVRLWKPMIEEMYKEEFGAEVASNSSSENGAGKRKDEPARSTEVLQSPSSAAAMRGAKQHCPFKSEVASGQCGRDDDGVNNVGSTAGLALQQRHHWPNANDILLQDTTEHHAADGGARFLDFGAGVAGLGSGAYAGGSVFLTLGLHRDDGVGGVTVVAADQPGLTQAARGHGVLTEAFEYEHGPDNRQQFGPSSQLRHDFVT